MSYKSQRSSRRNSKRGRRKIHQQKAKRKGPKHRSSAKYLLEASEAPTFQKVVEKTLSRLSNLGNQTFAVPPFSPYYNDWLFSLRNVLSEFESNKVINVDEEFANQCSQIMNNVELKLVERRHDEAALEKSTRRLVKQNNILLQTNAEYANTIQKLKSKRNRDVRRLTRIINAFEEELEETSRMKANILSPFARRAKSHKKAEVTRKLNAAKSELGLITKAFKVKQEKIRDEYEKKKQTIIEQVQNLEKKVEGLETDNSVEDRRSACKKLVKAVKALLQRKTPIP